jgi:hypothetical protein
MPASEWLEWTCSVCHYEVHTKTAEQAERAQAIA